MTGGFYTWDPGNLSNNISTHQHPDLMPKEFPQQVWAKSKLSALKLETSLDETHNRNTLFHRPHVLHGPGNKLMGQDPNKDTDKAN